MQDGTPSEPRRDGRAFGPGDKPLFLSGLVFLGIGIVGIAIGRHYQMGSVQNMGPGYFPVLLSSVLCVIGVLSILSALVRGVRQNMPAWPLVPAFSIAVGVFAFGLSVDRFGLIVASALLLLCIGHKQLMTRPVEYLLLASALVVFSALIFVKMLGLPIELWPSS